jgi:hypothetical protein
MTTDSPDFQLTIAITAVPTADNPDWQITATAPGGGGLGGYKSLTGPGQTATPGDLTQAGSFTVTNLNPSGTDGVSDGLGDFTSASGNFFPAYIGRNLTLPSGVYVIFGVTDAHTLSIGGPPPAGSGLTWSIDYPNGVMLCSNGAVPTDGLPLPGIWLLDGPGWNFFGQILSGIQLATDSADGIWLASVGGGNIAFSLNGGGNLRLYGLPVYANNAAALAGGLTAGDCYRTGADPDPICIVH